MTTPTPAVQELINVRISQLAWERNGKSFGSLAAAMANGTFKFLAKESQEWVGNVIRVMRSAPDARDHFSPDNAESAARYILQELYKRHPKLKGRRSIIP